MRSHTFTLPLTAQGRKARNIDSRICGLVNHKKPRDWYSCHLLFVDLFVKLDYISQAGHECFFFPLIGIRVYTLTSSLHCGTFNLLVSRQVPKQRTSVAIKTAPHLRFHNAVLHPSNSSHIFWVPCLHTHGKKNADNENPPQGGKSFHFLGLIFQDDRQLCRLSSQYTHWALSLDCIYNFYVKGLFFLLIWRKDR